MNAFDEALAELDNVVVSLDHVGENRYQLVIKREEVTFPEPRKDDISTTILLWSGVALMYVVIWEAGAKLIDLIVRWIR